MSVPLDILHFACTHSVSNNGLGVEGGKAFAAMLKDTQLTNLKCAPAPPKPEALAFV